MYCIRGLLESFWDVALLSAFRHSIRFGNRAICICRCITKISAASYLHFIDTRLSHLYGFFAVGCRKAIWGPNYDFFLRWVKKAKRKKQNQAIIFFSDRLYYCALICSGHKAIWGPNYGFFLDEENAKKNTRLEKAKNAKQSFSSLAATPSLICNHSTDNLLQSKEKKKMAKRRKINLKICGLQSSKALSCKQSSLRPRS